MKEFIEKLIGRLEEEKKSYRDSSDKHYNNGHRIQAREDMLISIGIDKAKEIVNQLAEEYKGGWISCSERLPEEAYGCLVTVMDCNQMTGEEFENILPYFVGYDSHTWNNADGEEIPFEVIAWQPLPTPYQPKGE